MKKNLSPTQKRDATIKDSIRTALWKDDVLRMPEYDEVDVHVKNGVVYLNGHIVGTASQNRIENTIRAIPGILEIKNNLVMDDKLVLEVAAALEKLEHVCDCKFFTRATHGVVSLGGIVNNDNVKLLAERCAASNPNVRGVINNIRISGTALTLEVQSQPFLQPFIGKDIYFLDGISGFVKQVVINPDNRRVIAMIVQGDFMDWQDELSLLTDGKSPLPKKNVTVPMSVVRYLTKFSGFLSIHNDERRRYADFDPKVFFVPNKDWVPPYPYHLDDILFPIAYQNMNMQIVSEPDRIPSGMVMENASAGKQFFATDSFGL